MKKKHSTRAGDPDYVISDYEDSDSEADHPKGAKKTTVPDWAHGDALKSALEDQHRPDRMAMFERAFGGDVSTCPLEDIFKTHKKRFTRRTSSANWAQDRLTDKEKQAYARSLYAGR